MTSDGAFELKGLFGERILQVIGLGEAWGVERIMNGKAVVESLTLNPGERLDQITIVLSRR